MELVIGGENKGKRLKTKIENLKTHIIFLGEDDVTVRERGAIQ